MVYGLEFMLTNRSFASGSFFRSTLYTLCNMPLERQLFKHAHL
jgi:hypothetical protein